MDKVGLHASPLQSVSQEDGGAMQAQGPSLAPRLQQDLVSRRCHVVSRVVVAGCPGDDPFAGRTQITDELPQGLRLGRGDLQFAQVQNHALDPGVSLQGFELLAQLLQADLRRREQPPAHPPSPGRFQLGIGPVHDEHHIFGRPFEPLAEIPEGPQDIAQPEDRIP